MRINGVGCRQHLFIGIGDTTFRNTYINGIGRDQIIGRFWNIYAVIENTEVICRNGFSFIDNELDGIVEVIVKEECQREIFIGFGHVVSVSCNTLDGHLIVLYKGLCKRKLTCEKK